jgi:hypothetical protein
MQLLEKNYTPEEVYAVLTHALIPTDFKKKMALFSLIQALEQEDEATDSKKVQEGVAASCGVEKSMTEDNARELVEVPLDTLRHWRVLVDDNPKDLAPRIEAYLPEEK